MRVKKGIELQNVCNEHLLIPAGIENVDFSKIISLNPTAAYLWENIAELDNFNIDTLVERIVDGKVKDGELRMSPLTFRDIETIKKTFKERLKAIYHTRISYPTEKKK